MRGDCDYCGSVLCYRASAARVSLATPEQKQAMGEELLRTGDTDRALERLSGYGSREVWVLSWTCRGCGRQGSDCGQHCAREEAERIAAEQNRRTDTPEARERAAVWVQEVLRRAEREARVLMEQFAARFPEWSSRIQFIPSSEARGPDEHGWDCALKIRIPAESPGVDAPLELWVLCRQVLLTWSDFWHAHAYAEYGADSEDLQHLDEALDLLEKLVTEQIVIWAEYQAGHLVAGGHLPAGEQPIADTSWADHIVLRSWRGTYDRMIVLESASKAEDL